MSIKGNVRVDKKTKNLVKRLCPGEIALICHRDLDELGALSLINARVKAVVNADISISGKYPNLGPELLCKEGIPLIDGVGLHIMNQVKEGDILEICGGDILKHGEIIGSGTVLDAESVREMMNRARDNIEKELDSFIDNTLEYAKREKRFILGQIEMPHINTRVKGRHALVVVRGRDYKVDLGAIRSYIEEVKPVLIGVDGGADALMEFGLVPDIIIGDMDSVSDRALKSCSDIIVHAYADGRAPGLDRVEALGLNASILSIPGTSEDIAMLLSFEKGAELIVAVGTHSNMIDFLEKGRRGMASTFLTRLKVGSILVDAKGVNKLYRETIKAKHLAGLVVAAMIPVLIVGFMSPPLQQLVKLLAIRMKLIMGF
ncbi:MAG: Thiamine pyrophosphokinase domain-containing protein [Firmicutes bacterium]|nr:Thiamine pyrophosphokinase domain-containing protein [Bacillota bacterium]MDI6706033.1 putative cytokinetic ring protein SteA [Bacillota bacterium]